MGWRGDYYYRSKRCGERVVTEYVGSGPVAQLIAERDAEARRQRQEQRRQRAAELAEDRAWDALDRTIRLLAKGELILVTRKDRELVQEMNT